MLNTEIDEFLVRSLEDRRLSRNERQTLAQALAGLEGEEDRLALCRRAFELGREALPSDESGAVLGWLEEIVAVGCRSPERGRDVPSSEAYFSPGEGCPRRIIQLFEHAQRSVEICVFTITDDRISDAILKTHRRGIAIRVVTDNDKLHDEGSDVDRFLEAGIALRIDRTDNHMHHKFAIFDNTTLLTGSYNWTRSASRFNDENLIVTSDRSLIGSFSKVFEGLWKRLE